MMKVTAFVGSARKKHTYNAAKTFLEKLQSYQEIEYEIVRLNEYNIKTCQGCKVCFDMGKNLCPLKDDRDKLINKMINSDGVIFASPNYSFQVSGLMKIFIDRIAFFLHRPQFFGKTYTSIVPQGVFGGSKIIKYLSSIGDGLGYNVIKGCCIKTLEPISKKQETKNTKALRNLSRKFYSQLIKEEYPTPSVLKLMIFRITRSKIKMTLNEDYQDYRYYKDKGWFKSSYYYPVQINPFKRLLGNIFEKL